ncbi:MAG: ThiF family adenylyltransferase, partial [Rhodoferax sp.]
MFHEKVYYAEPGGFLKPVESNAWRDIAIEGIDVLSGLSKSMARVQSGVRDEGPTAVLVGGGSLGATMLDAWLRSGWGIWSVVDDDYLKPHNLVRHPAESWAIGLNKAITAAGRAQNLFQDANPVAAIASNGLDTENPELVKAFAAANLVVDATADLDFPRKASMTEGGPRHASAFLTPSANCSVLLVEDAGRNSKLRTLEAQYYRAILNEAWGESHLSGHRGRLWTGGGCRDKSTVMPYSAVMVHAANLAEQIRYRQVLPEACAKLWERNPNTGEVIARSLTCELESTLQVGAVLVSLDHGLIHKLRDLREAQLPLETGG